MMMLFANLKNKIKKGGKNAFILWIVYQTIKGTLTTTFIWAPILYLYFTGG